MSTTERDVNDIDAIVGANRSNLDEVIHAVDQHSEVLFTWDYERSRKALEKLYEKAKTSQWNGKTDLPWDLEVDNERLAAEFGGANTRFTLLAEAEDSPLAAWGPAEWSRFAVEQQTWLLSQFLHGEQGALACTGLITATVPWIDAKYYAATQVMDEARHVEVFARYIEEKMGGAYPINPNLGGLLDTIINDSRWDITYLGMQIMVEGLALAAFGMMHSITTEPLLKQLLRYVMSDEARHVAFGVLSLKEFYAGLSYEEIVSRQEFAFEAALALRNRFYAPEVWERMGADPRVVIKFITEHDAPENDEFQALLFSKIVPNCKKLGLLDAGDGWLRQRFTDIGVIKFEDWTDTSAEYGTLDAVAQDRATA